MLRRYAGRGQERFCVCGSAWFGSVGVGFGWDWVGLRARVPRRCLDLIISTVARALRRAAGGMVLPTAWFGSVWGEFGCIRVGLRAHPHQCPLHIRTVIAPSSLAHGFARYHP